MLKKLLFIILLFFSLTPVIMPVSVFAAEGINESLPDNQTLAVQIIVLI